jgi:hypothetical protein
MSVPSCQDIDERITPSLLSSPALGASFLAFFEDPEAADLAVGVPVTDMYAIRLKTSLLQFIILANFSYFCFMTLTTVKFDL